MDYKQLISRYRTELMGFAILWICLHHTGFFGMVEYNLFNYFVRAGSCGVDIFLFLSAFGLYYAISKNFVLFNFYKRRVTRILPVFIIICIIVSIVKSGGTNLFSLKYWYFNFRNNWYISFILLMYFLYPIIYRIQKKSLYLPLFLSWIFTILMTFVLYYINMTDIHDVPMLCTQRFPIFCMGSLVADERFKCSFNIFQVFFLTILSFLFLFVMFYFDKEIFVYPIFFFITISLIPAIDLILDKFGHTFVYDILKYFGQRSLMIYLIHMLIFPYYDKFGEYGGSAILIISIIVLIISELFYRIDLFLRSKFV